MSDPLFEKFGVTKKAGQIIFCENEPGSTLFFLQTGSVRITKIVGNKEKTLAVLPAGEIFGEMAILESAPRSATAIVEEDAKMLELDKESFSQLVTAQPTIALKLLRIFAQRISDQKRKYKIIALPDPEARIMDVFLMLAEKKGLDIEASREVSFDIEGSDVAAWAGIPPQDCARSLNNLEKNGKLILGSKQIKVTNLYQFSRTVGTKRQSQERNQG